MKPRGQWVSDIGTTIMVLCAIVAVSIMVRREFFSPSNTTGQSGVHPSRQIEHFDSIAAVGHRFGRVDAPVTVVEFGDFECPVCRSFETTALLPMRQAFPRQLAVVFRQWPLSYHRFAYPAARAAECAGQQGRFAEFHDLLYAKQDSLGLKSFVAYALESGVSDSAAFIRCNSGSTKVSAIEEDMAVATRLKMSGTPTVIVDGIMLGYLPDSAGLDSLMRASLKRHAQ